MKLYVNTFREKINGFFLYMVFVFDYFTPVVLEKSVPKAIMELLTGGETFNMVP